MSDIFTDLMSLKTDIFCAKEARKWNYASYVKARDFFGRSRKSRIITMVINFCSLDATPIRDRAEKYRESVEKNKNLKECFKAEVEDALERLRMDYSHADIKGLRGCVNNGLIDAEEFNLARAEGWERRQEDSYMENSGLADRSGYGGYLDERDLPQP